MSVCAPIRTLPISNQLLPHTQTDRPSDPAPRREQQAWAADEPQRTVRKPQFRVVRRRARAPCEIHTLHVDIVPFELVPVHHLLRAADAARRAVFAPCGRRSGGKRGTAGGAGDFAFEALHVHVGFAAAGTVGVRAGLWMVIGGRARTRWQPDVSDGNEWGVG